MTQKIYLFRHGETEWSKSGRHTGLTDIQLTPEGKSHAAPIASYLENITLSRVFTSPLRRAHETCDIAGVADRAESDNLLVEWNYGEYEGLTTKEIQSQRPGWMLFKDGCPNGETPSEVAGRADAMLEKIRKIKGDIALFSHGDLLRILTARWLGLAPEKAQHFVLNTATLSILGYYHDISPAIITWNSTLVRM